jgi:hypothetical protein
MIKRPKIMADPGSVERSRLEPRTVIKFGMARSSGIEVKGRAVGRE